MAAFLRRQTVSLLLKEEIIRFYEGLLPLSGDRPFLWEKFHRMGHGEKEVKIKL